MKFRLEEQIQTLSGAYTYYSEPLDIGSIGADSYSVLAALAVDTPAAQVVPSASINASTDTWTKTAHGFSTGLKVQISTSTALPSPLVVLTDYFIIKLTDDTFQLASTLNNAIAGTKIDLSDAGTGNQTVTPVALAGGTIKLQQTDAKPVLGIWADLGSATNVTTTANVYLEKDRPTSRWIRVAITLTAGHISASLYELCKGDKE